LVAGILVLAAPEPRCTWMTTMSYVAELERLANSLCRDVSRTSEFSMLPIAERMAKTLGVKPDGVAILGLSARWRHLYFLAPENLKNVGFIPLNSTSALAARTARESRPEIINNFASVRHACVFEAVKSAGEPGDQIQRIISAPVLCGETVVGDFRSAGRDKLWCFRGQISLRPILGRRWRSAALWEKCCKC
jgi:hypothetical protein